MFVTASVSANSSVSFTVKANCRAIGFLGGPGVVNSAVATLGCYSTKDAYFNDMSFSTATQYSVTTGQESITITNSSNAALSVAFLVTNDRYPIIVD